MTVKLIRYGAFSLNYLAQMVFEEDQGAHDDTVSKYAFHRAECSFYYEGERRKAGGNSYYVRSHEMVFYLETQRTFVDRAEREFLSALFCAQEKDLLQRVLSQGEFNGAFLKALWKKLHIPQIPIPTVSLQVARGKHADLDIDELERLGIVRPSGSKPIAWL